MVPRSLPRTQRRSPSLEMESTTMAGSPEPRTTFTPDTLLEPPLLQLQVVGNDVGGDVAAGPADVASRVRARAAEVKAANGGPVWAPPMQRPEDAKLLLGCLAGAQITFDHGRVSPLDIQRAHNVATQDITWSHIGGVAPQDLHTLIGIVFLDPVPLLGPAVLKVVAGELPHHPGVLSFRGL